MRYFFCLNPIASVPRLGSETQYKLLLYIGFME